MSTAPATLLPEPTPAGGDQGTSNHTLSDWLALHELDAPTCARLLGEMTAELAGDAAPLWKDTAYPPLALEAAWSMTRRAWHAFVPDRRDVVDDTMAHMEKIVVNRPNHSRKALTLDHGPGTYPTVVHGYYEEPADLLIIAHEFGHALQIRVGGETFVPPVVREICAFLSESALLRYVRTRDATRHACLRAAWQKDTQRYFGPQRDRLLRALTQPGTPYRYGWNYPIARYLALAITRDGAPDLAWRVFQERLSVPGILAALTRPRDG